MTEQDKTRARRIALLMRYGRKRKNLTQQNIAKTLGISQGALSKIENGLLIPSAPQWFDFCELTELPPTSLQWGYIENPSPAVLQTGAVEGSFRIPRSYATERSSKVRMFAPYLDYFERQLGAEKLDRYFEHAKLDAAYFVDRDHQINFSFPLDLIRHIITEGKLKADDLQSWADLAASPKTNGKIGEYYKEAGSVSELMATHVKYAPYYTCNFTYEIQEQDARCTVVSVTPVKDLVEKHLRRDDPVLGDVLCRARKARIQVLGKTFLSKALQIDEDECYFRGSSRCVYKVCDHG